ncbi:hypothetical protein GCM10019996_21240 [Lentilactobacillus parakefiri]
MTATLTVSANWITTIIFERRNFKMEKQDLASAYRRMKSPNIKTRKRALKIIHEIKRAKQRNLLKEK